MYGVYDDAARVHWAPSKIFGDEIQVSMNLSGAVFTLCRAHVKTSQIIGSFAQTYCFPRAVAYLDSGKVNVKGMVGRLNFPIELIWALKNEPGDRCVYAGGL